jgi:cysteine synthase A
MSTSSLLSLIGRTPMVRLARVAGDVGAEVLVKLEYLNPSGSIKDRIALRMIEEAERAGTLRNGMEIVEASTGNTATALAFVGAVKGYRVHLFIPAAAASEERLRIMKAYGAEVTFTDEPGAQSPADAGGGLHGSVVENVPRQWCLDLERGAPGRVWWARQFCNPANADAHEFGTGREIVTQCDGRVDAFVAAIGTCGTLIGVARALRAANPAVHIAAVEPKSSPLIQNGRLAKPVHNPAIAGGLLSDLVEQKTAQEILLVSQDEAIDMTHRLCREEGLFCGLSGGANVVAALRIARQLKPGQRVVTVLPDNRDRYLFKEQFTT